MIWFPFCFMRTHKKAGGSSCRVGTVKWFLKCERACLRSQGWMRCVFLIGTQRSVEGGNVNTGRRKDKNYSSPAPPLMCSFCASPLCRVGGRCSMKCCSMEVLDWLVAALSPSLWSTSPSSLSSLLASSGLSLWGPFKFSNPEKQKQRTFSLSLIKKIGIK